MGPRLFEWVVRTVMLVLAGLVTLSILGSIAAMSDQAADPGAIGGRDRAVLAPAPQVAPSASDPAPAAPQQRQAPTAAPPPAADASTPGEIVQASAAPEAPPPERWLEAIAYALLAIAGLLALLLILVWRGIRSLARIADRAELGQQRL